MKKLICLICALALTAALAGCSSGAPAVSEPDNTPAAADTGKPDNTENSPSAAPDSSASPDAEAQPSGSPAQAADISSAVDADSTSDTSTAAIGQWVKTARYATEDKTYHTVYVRVVKVTTQTADADYVQSAIELSNENSSDYSQIDVSALNLPSDVELCVLDYEVFVPEDFPGPDYGITEPTMDFSQSNVGGGGIPSADGASVYIGLGSNTTDLATETDPTYQPGNTYSFRSMFTMVKGYTDYVLEFTSYPEGTVDSSADIMYHAYFASK